MKDKLEPFVIRRGKPERPGEAGSSQVARR